MRNNSFSIAAGCEYGVLSRVSNLTRLSILELALLSLHRAYFLTVKVKNPSGLPGSNSLRGDIVCFTQEGPAEALKLLGSIGDTVRERVAWVRGGGNFRVVTVDDQGNMENWLRDNAVLVARPYVLFNELRIRAKLDEATENENGHPAPQDATFHDDFVLPLDGLAHDIFMQARKLDDKTSVALNVACEVNASDVANVRTLDKGGEMDSVGVMSSSRGDPLKATKDTPDLDAILALVQGNTEADDCFDEEDAENCEEEKGGLKATVTPNPPIISSQLPRGSDAINEFKNNGLTIMSIFRHLFPLMHSKTIRDAGKN